MIAQYAAGRIVLHLVCIAKGGKLTFHLAGIRRELPRGETILVALYLSPVWIGIVAKLTNQ
jgi:hypothetical protein